MEVTIETKFSVEGIEPSLQASKAWMRPLHFTKFNLERVGMVEIPQLGWKPNVFSMKLTRINYIQEIASATIKLYKNIIVM